MRTLVVASLVVCLNFTPLPSTGAAPVQFSTFVHTNLRLTDIAWTGSRFLFVDNTTNRVFASGPSGAPQTLFATMPRQVEETRCQSSPGTHEFTPGAIYCHAPGNKIYRIGPGGIQVSVFAPASALAPYAGDVVVDTELRGLFWAVQAQGSHLVATPLPTNLNPAHNNFEGAMYIGG